MLWRQKPHSILDIWLLVVLCAWFFEIALVAIFNAGRYDIGFYAGRIYSLLASLFILVVLLTEQIGVYSSLVAADQTARSEAELRESREVLRLAMQGGRMGAWSRDLVRNTVWWSQELEEIFGLAPGTFAGNHGAFVALVHPDDSVALRRAVDEAIRDHVDYAVEFQFRHSSGEWRWMDGRGRAIYHRATRCGGGIATGGSAEGRVPGHARARAAESAGAHSQRRRDPEARRAAAQWP